MVRTRKAIYVGNQEVQRRYIGNKLIFENIDDMDDKIKLSGVVIFTDKADNSVVHVDVDGKSGGGGSGKNLLDVGKILRDSGSSVSITNFQGRESLKFDVGPLSDELVIKVDFKEKTPYTFQYEQVHESGETMSLKYNYTDGSDDFWDVVSENSYFTKIEFTSDPNKTLDSVTTVWHIGGNGFVALDTFQIEEGSTATAYEPPSVPTPDYPIEIHSLNDFDVVSSTEKLSEGQLEEYDYDTEYENIHKTNISLSEPLRSVGDVKDRLFRDSDGLWKVERNIRESEVSAGGMYSNGITDTFTTFIFTPSMASLGFQTSRCSHFINRNDGWNSPTFTHYSDSTSAYNRYFMVENTVLGVDSSDSNGVRLSKARSWLSNESSKGTPVTLVYKSREPHIETLDQELQDKLNNLRSFKNSNYVYTVINDVLPTVAENLKPTLHATFKSKGWYDDYQNTLLE